MGRWQANTLWESSCGVLEVRFLTILSALARGYSSVFVHNCTLIGMRLKSWQEYAHQNRTLNAPRPRPTENAT
eukprot:2078176-Amphidinium_carterae.1